MKKRFVRIAGVMMTLLFLTGCGSGIEITEEESDIISQYAASLLLKYDVNYNYALMEEEQEEVTVPDEPESEVPDESEGENGSLAPDVEGNGEQESQGSSLSQALGMDGLNFNYAGYEFADSYPTDGNISGSFLMRAEEGKKLLILKFGISNTTSEVQKMDVLSGIPTFKVTVNGTSVANRMTILLEDLSTTSEDVEPGKTVEKILIFQVNGDMDETVETMELLVTYNKNASRISLVP